MPNWCANRMYFRASPARIDEISKFSEGTVTPLYLRAVQEGIQLFVAGSAGLLQPTVDMPYAPYPALTACGKGEDVSRNRAFTRWLDMLINGAELTDENCLTLHTLWQMSGIGGQRWGALSAGAQTVITGLMDRKHFDWSGDWQRKDIGQWWERLCENRLPGKTLPLNMLLVLPTRLDIEINGFNGKLLDGIPSSYSWYVDRYDTKWPVGYELNISARGADFIQVDFDSPWCPPGEAVAEAMSRQFECSIEHWYAEQGCDFCGYARYEAGEQAEAFCDSLERECPDDEDGFAEITGPEWLVNNVAHFGG